MASHSTIRTLMAATVLAAAAGPAVAATIVVRPGDGTPIADALGDAQDGDRIILKRGVYNEAATVDADGVRIIGQGAVWEATFGPDGDDGTCLTVNGDNVTVQGIFFRNADDLVVVQGDDALFRNCRFRGSDDDGVEVINGDDTAFDRCRFTANSGAGVNFDRDGTGGSITRSAFLHSSASGAYAIDVNRANVTVDRCVIRNIDGGGIELSSANGSTISRCTVVNANGDGIYAHNSDDVVIQRNRIHNTYEQGIEARDGDRLEVDRNLVTGAREDTLVVTSGASAQITGNRVSGSYCDGIEHNGANALIENNQVFDVVCDAIRLAGGEDSTIRGNRMVGGASGGLVVNADMVTIENNFANDFANPGFGVTGSNCTIRNNVAVNCGSYRGDSGFRTTGDTNTLTGNRALRIFGDGFRVSGDDNSLTDCTAIDCVGDGIDIDGEGSDNSLTDCLVKKCDGEALDNSGTDTDVTGCRFFSSRILLGNDGTFDLFSGNNVDEGDAVPGEID